VRLAEIIGLQTQTIQCPCGIQFAWTVGEQVYALSKGLKHKPKWCKRCKEKRQKGIRPVTRAMLLNRGGVMTTKHVDHSVEGLYQRLTGGMYFAPERNRTKQAVENVLKAIEPKLELTDANVLGNLEVYAPSLGSLCRTMPVFGKPVVWLNPQIEETEDFEAIETSISLGFARGIQIIRGVEPTEVENRAYEMMKTWGFEIAMPQRVGAAA
jgi:hypothetical protein